MVAFNITLDDSSPLVSYSGSWLDTPGNDSLAANYTGASFHTSNTTGSTATLKFNGTGVWFYGAHLPQYGNYSITVDGQIVASGTASSGTSVPVFDQLLGSSFNLSMGQHVAVLSSVNGGAIDLDKLIFETQVGSQGGQVSQTVFKDTDSQIQYLPAPAWSVSEQSFFSNGSAHFTESSGSKATLSFTGDAVAVYGGVSFDHGLYSVSVDGQSQQLNGGGYDEYHPQGLGSGSHNLTVTSGTGFLDLDTIIVLSATGQTNDTKTSSSDPTLPTAMGNNGGSMEGQSVNNAPNQDTLHVNSANDNNNGSDASGAAKIKSVPPAVLAAIVGASIIGLVSIIIIAIFIAQQIRNRHRAVAAAAQATESPTFIQDPDLEAGPRGGFSEKAVGRNLQRSNSRWTIKSFTSRWSQASFPGQVHDSEPPPAVPPLPPSLARLAPPVPGAYRGSQSSVLSGSSSSETLYSQDSQHGSYDHKTSVMVEVGPGRGSIESAYHDSSNGAIPAPQRPARPPGLDLRDLEHIEL
ncbi:hypothetical protein BDY19DRAFT_902909 [Irpex rosettiformis]|uniref:Uncharacterized protein n=1 Tax=Irpex rosettiformis TaxID=378272 RepID=A0ACB8UFP3_9APHY|nr:hypothetical protein BDY19DRAFT_902909 [Irpex rosettiformis]